MRSAVGGAILPPMPEPVEASVVLVGLLSLLGLLSLAVVLLAERWWRERQSRGKKPAPGPAGADVHSHR